MSTPASSAGADIYRSLFLAYPDGVLLIGADGRIVLANPSAARLLGYAEQDLVGLRVDTLVPEDMRGRHAAHRDAYAHAPRPRPMGAGMDLVARRRDGSVVMVEIGLSPLQHAGQPCVVAAIRAIGEYPRVQAALRRQRYSEHIAEFGRLAVDKDDLQSLVEQAPRIAAAALQAEHAVVYLLEPATMELVIAAGVNLLPEHHIGSHVPNRPDHLPGHVIADGRPVVVDVAYESRFVDLAPDRDAGVASVAAVPLSDRGRIAGVLVARAHAQQRFGDDEVQLLQSLSSLLATCLQRARSEETLQHAQRLDSVGQLAGGVAHDFNNLLTVVSGNLQALEERPSIQRDAPGRQMLQAASRACDRGTELTTRLLAWSRRQVLQPVRVDVGPLLQSLAWMLRRTLDKRIRIALEVAPGCPPCRADAAQLESALLNVAINARDAMPAGGRLVFRAREAIDAPLHGMGWAATAAHAGYVAIEAADTGCGMPPAVARHAFEPFFTTKAPGRGTGLGLSTVYGFARQSGGIAMLDSRPGSGTVVTLYLPQWREAEVEAAGAADDNETPAPLPSGLRVLLVDDDIDVRDVIRGHLVALGCEVSACASGEHALAQLAAGCSRFDLLLTDIALGTRMQGTELAQQARRLSPAISVLLTTGYEPDLPAMTLSSPLLRKPFSRAALTQAIAQALR